WRPLAEALRHVAAIEGSEAAAKPLLHTALMTPGQLTSRAQGFDPHRHVPDFDPQAGLPPWFWVNEPWWHGRGDQVIWAENMVTGYVRVKDEKLPATATGVEVYWPDRLALWPLEPAIEQRTEPKPLGRSVQLALDALNALAKDNTDVRNMPDNALLALVKKRVAERTQGKA